ncbi:hypothetical protein ACKVMT_00010 [Halobacteriales archaeon Cl-PHB]
MDLDIGAALRDGFDRMLERNALVLVAAFVVVQVGNTIVGQSMARQLLAAIDYRELLAEADPEVVAEIRSAIEQATELAWLDFSVAVLGLLFVLVFLVQLVLRVGAIRTFVGDETEALPAEHFTRRLVYVLVNLVVGAILYGLAVVVGLVLFVLPGIFLAVALFFYNYAIVVEDENVFEAFATSWELTKGNRLRLFLLGLIVAIASTIAGTLAGFVGLLGPTADVLVQSLFGAAVTVFGVAVAAQAYRQLTAEPDVEDDEEVGALGPDDLA